MKKSNKKNFSVIIVNFNGGNKLFKSVKSVLKQDHNNFEIIIVDNNSSDNSLKKINQLNSNLIHIIKLKKNLGFTVGANLGIKRSKGNFFLLLNNDAYLESTSFISNSIKLLSCSNNHIAAIFPKVLFNWENTIINSSYVVWHERQMWYDSNNGRIDFKNNKFSKEVFGAMFVAPIFKREIWNDIGGFDEMFFTYGEDFDISYRANSFGYKFLYSNDLTVLHDFRSSSNEKTNFLWSYFYFQRNYLYVIFKNYQLINIFKHFTTYSSIFFKSFFLGLKNRNKSLVCLHLRVIKDITLNFPKLLKKRIYIQKKRKVGDSEIWNQDFVLNYNPFFYNSKIVINLLNINYEKNNRI